MADTYISIPVATATMGPLNPGGYHMIPCGSVELSALPPFGVVGIPFEDMLTARYIFRCVLTGADNGLDDLELPISSFSATVREGDPTYLSCNIPNGSAYINEIQLRTDGDILIRAGVALSDGYEYLEEIVRVNYETLRTELAASEGITTDYAIITGHKTRTLNQSKEWELQGVSYYAISDDGKRRLRGDLDFQLRCGDILTYGDDTLVVGAISYSVTATPALKFMEIEEA
jgi:hypothetical protein